MKIIKPGIPIEELARRKGFNGECPDCTCLFECLEEEVFDRRGGDQHEKESAACKCPHCGRLMSVYPLFDSTFNQFFSKKS